MSSISKLKRKRNQSVSFVSAKKCKLEPTSIHGKLATLRLKTAKSVAHFEFNMERVRKLTVAKGKAPAGVLYWMTRDMRVQDNWAMLYSQKMAMESSGALHVLVCVAPLFLKMTWRHYHFMLEGLKEVAEECRNLNINFHLHSGKPHKCFETEFLESYDIGLIVTDFSPLREHLEDIYDVKSILPQGLAFHQVDAHNVVSCWTVSDKQEYSARTIRKKITKKLPSFLTQFPPVVKHSVTGRGEVQEPNWDAFYKSIKVDRKGYGVEPVEWAVPGTRGGLDRVHKFVTDCLKHYADKRNDPVVDALSNISPWVNFGQISMQRAILHAKQFGKKYPRAVASFVEEGVIRKELSDNFCFYNKNYDRLEGASEWARKTLQDHAKDKRDYLYTMKQWQKGETHDDLWNAAQKQLVVEGKMHGFMRMYWAKKILEWSVSPKEALTTSLYLNDRFSLDGNSPSGFVGCMWSVCGIHDQGWKERPVFGKIRFMNYNGCKKKFDIKAYIARYAN
jgi:deoxyribodipyrimidine photo-lyase